MTIITRYIIREFLKVFAVALAAFVTIYVLVDFFERIDNFLEAGAGLGRVLLYVLFKLPLIIDQMIPVAVLMASIITLGLLARGNEIMALKASGVSLLSVTSPLIMVGLVISLLSFVNSEAVVPYTNRRVNHIWKTHAEKHAPGLAYKYESLWYRGQDAIYSVRTFDVATNTLFGMIINQFDADYRIKRRVRARRVVWKDDGWHFLNGIVKERQQDGSYAISAFSETDYPLNETVDDFKRGAKPSEEMGFAELRRYAKKIEREGYSARAYWVDMHVKLAFPCISLIMCLVGASLALRQEQGRGVAAGIGIGFGIVTLYLVTFELCRTLGYTGILPPVVAAWASNILFGAVGTYLLLHSNQ